MGLSQSLPVTSYIKMIDIWMLFTMTIPFLEVVLHTLHEVFKRPSTFHIVPEPRVDVLKVQSEEEEVAKKNNSMKMTKVACAMGSLMLPICSLVFTITFWAVGIGSVILWDFGLPPFPQLSKKFKNAHFCWKFKFL